MVGCKGLVQRVMRRRCVVKREHDAGESSCGRAGGKDGGHCRPTTRRARRRWRGNAAQSGRCELCAGNRCAAWFMMGLHCKRSGYALLEVYGALCTFARDVQMCKVRRGAGVMSPATAAGANSSPLARSRCRRTLATRVLEGGGRRVEGLGGRTTHS